MHIAIIGSGQVGSALARRFSESGIAVHVANSRGPASIEALGRTFAGCVTPTTLEEAVKAEVVILAVPFSAHPQVAKAASNWGGRIVVDAMNTYGVPPERLQGQPSSVVVAAAFAGADLVKTFNQLPAQLLGANPVEAGGRRVLFLAGDDTRANAAVSKLVGELGFAPVALGSLSAAGTLLDKDGPLVLQNLIKKG